MTGAPSSAIFLTALVRSFLSLFLTMGSCSTCDHATRHARMLWSARAVFVPGGRERGGDGVPAEPDHIRLRRVDKQSCHAV